MLHTLDTFMLYLATSATNHMCKPHVYHFSVVVLSFFICPFLPYTTALEHIAPLADEVPSFVICPDAVVQ